jgi:hypothetical protein
LTQLFANNAQSTVASLVGAADNTVQVASGDGSLFPTPAGGDYFRVTLTQAGDESSWEILTCTARSGDVLTVTRAQEGTATATWAVGSKVELRLTAGVLWPLESSVSGNLPVANLDGGTNADATTVWHGDGAWRVPASVSGTVTSVDITPPSEGITASGGPITSSGSIVLELANDLAAVEDLFGAGIAVRVDEDVWELREIEGAPTRIDVVDGDGSGGNPTIDISASYNGQSTITTLGTVVIGGWQATPVDVPYGGTGLVSVGSAGSLLYSTSPSTLGIVPPSADGFVLTLVSGAPDWQPSTLTGGTVTSVGITPPAAGITVSGGPVTTSGAITLALANDLAGLEGLSSSGLASRTGVDTWAVRAVVGVNNRTTITDGNGVAGDPTVDIAVTYVGQTSITTLGTVGTGVWQGTTVAANFGGTGFISYAVGDILFASTTSVLSKLADVATGNALISGGVGVAPAWGKIGLATHVSGSLPAGNGGTGYSSFTDGDLLVGLNGAVIAKLAIGSTNQVLTVVGGLPAWGGAPSSALTSTNIGYGNGSNVLTGTSTFTWTNSTLTMQMGAGTGVSTIQTAAASSGSNAASLTIQTGAANSGVVGAGLLTLQGGAGAGTSAAGSVAITAGNNPSSGAGGSVSITAGTSSSGTAGNFTVVVNGTTRLTIANTGAATFQSSLAGTSGVFSSTLESTSLLVTGSTAPANGMYLQAAGVVGLAANSTAAYKYGSNAFLSQTDNSRDLGEASTGRWRNLYIVNSPTVGSDLRGKTDVVDCDLGLNFVLALRPIAYRQLVGKVEVSKDGLNTETPVPGDRVHRGFGAQQVREVLGQFGLDGRTFAGWCLADPADPESRQALRHEQFIAPMVKAIQEQAAQIAELRAQVTKLLGG